MTQLFQTLWSLRTHPFRPDADAQGQPFGPDILLKPLDPHADQRLIDFYYDLYDWRQSSLIQGLAKNVVFRRFPTEADLVDPKSLLILIAGEDNTGRESLRNLILHKIQAQTCSQPLVVEATLDSQNPAENVKTVARVFMNEYDLQETQPPFEELQRIYLRETREQGAGADTYSTLFQLWRPRVRKHCPRPIVLLLTSGDRYDNWQAIYNATRHLFNYIVVLTKNVPNAETCNKLVKAENKNVVLIKARRLELQEARAYLEARLAQERLAQVAPPDPLLPFADEALKALYEPGPSAKPSDIVRWDIGWLNKTFLRALDDHLTNLSTLAQQQSQRVEDLPPPQLVIGASAVRAARESLNQGQ
jgi:hypothetical protein